MFKKIVVLCVLLVPSIWAGGEKDNEISTEARIKLLVQYKTALEAQLKIQAATVQSLQAQVQSLQNQIAAQEPISTFNQNLADTQAKISCRLDNTFACIPEEKKEAKK